MEIKSKNKTALVFGATGLTGSQLTKVLLEDDRYSHVRIFSRHPVDHYHPKLEVVVNDLNDIRGLSSEIKGDEVFCCLGTTMKKAGSKKSFERIDLEIPLEIASVAKRNGVGKYLVISSIGANPKSRNFYLNVKGRLEEELKNIGFRQLSVFRPSMLLGDRQETRLGESAGKLFFKVFSFAFIGPLKKYKGIKAETVARAMIRVANNVPARITYESDEIQKMGSIESR